MDALLHALLANLAVVGLIVFAWTNTLDWVKQANGMSTRLAFGVLTGLGCVTLISMPFRMGDGILLDLRSTLLALSGFFGGPTSAAVSAAIAGTYRMHLGGEGLLAGIVCIVAAASIGVVSRFLERSRVRGLPAMTYLGLWAAAGNVLCFLFLPANAIGPAFNTAALPLGAIVFASTLISGMALVQDGRRREVIQANHMYRAVIEALPDCLNVKDAEGCFLIANPATAHLMGARNTSQLIGRTDYDFYPTDIAAEFRADEQAVCADGRPRTIEQQVRHRDGRSGWLSTLKAPLTDERGNFVGLITHNRDITELRELQAEYERQRTLLSDAMTHMADAVAMFGDDGRIVFCNERYREFFPLTADIRVPGASIQEVLLAAAERGEEKLPEGMSAQEWANKLSGNLTQAGDLRFQLADGRWLEARSRPTTDGCLVVLSDVTQSQLAEEALRSLNNHLKILADTDGLTGLVNRRGFDQALEREVRNAQRTGRPVSLLLIDLDRFKAYNDLYGHPAGDECLRAVAECLRLVLRRPLDVAARYGGEELAAVLPDTDLTGAVEVAEAFSRALRSRRLPHDASEKGRVTASVGVAMGGSSVRELLLRADEALYTAKGAGRDAVRAWRPAQRASA
ncbi:diguanylate cyclase [Chthonobacter albigriseus]|uniref:diguanylate cyclase n=1 Tax=Chthonobacter albigriseus TaxID=1683161 RepID=UPI0015EE8769|nr:diguanylate cyclase [Chthonobacter albigriseus]